MGLKYTTLTPTLSRQMRGNPKEISCAGRGSLSENKDFELTLEILIFGV